MFRIKVLVEDLPVYSNVCNPEKRRERARERERWIAELLMTNDCPSAPCDDCLRNDCCRIDGVLQAYLAAVFASTPLIFSVNASTLNC